MLLAQLGELDRAVLRRQEEEEAKVEGDISLLSILICEMEEKLKRPTREFLQVGFLRVGFLRVGYSIGSSPFLTNLLQSWGRLNHFFPSLSIPGCQKHTGQVCAPSTSFSGVGRVPHHTPMDSSTEMRNVCDSGKVGSPMGIKKCPWIPM